MNGIERGCLAGHARAALVPLVCAALDDPRIARRLERDLLAAVDVVAHDLSEGRPQAAAAVAALAASDRFARPAARALLPHVADSVQETPRNPGVFGLWRPLSRSDSSRFGSFLDR